MEADDLDSRVGGLLAKQRAALMRDVGDARRQGEGGDLEPVVANLLREATHFVERPPLEELVADRESHPAILYLRVSSRVSDTRQATRLCRARLRSQASAGAGSYGSLTMQRSEVWHAQPETSCRVRGDQRPQVAQRPVSSTTVGSPSAMQLQGYSSAAVQCGCARKRVDSAQRHCATVRRSVMFPPVPSPNAMM